MDFVKAAAGAIFCVALWIASGNSALARPEYNKTFWTHYAQQLAAQNNLKCIACHEGPDKKNRNNYGKVVQEKLVVKGEKDIKKIKAALEEAAKEPSAIEGKTFGDLINEGKLPATKP